MTRYFFRIFFTYFIFALLRSVERRFGFLGILLIVPLSIGVLFAAPVALRLLAVFLQA